MLDEAENQTQALSETELTQSLEALCQSKAEEFYLLGYEQVKAEEVWACVSEAYGANRPRLYEIVNHVLTLKITRFMNWLTMKELQQVEIDR
ncbi:MAG: hypothetical protein JWN30_2833 [Bacilli bacterium]|nr:hypothetical protein [Bacilli bacterium]